MDFLTKKKYTFTSAALPPETFGVVEFRGREGLSLCYEFQVLLVSDNLEVDLAQVMQHPATFAVLRLDGQVIEHHGIVLRFEQLHAVEGCAFYRASLGPRLYWLSLGQRSQVFLDRSVPEIAEACLKDGGLTALDYEFRLQGEYPALEYVCQYNESLLDFLSRWLEREGIYYWFEQGPSREKVIFTDTKIGHGAHPQGGALTYAPPSGLEAMQTEELVRNFNCLYRQLPASVQVKDYNYRKPSLAVAGTAEVDGQGRGQVSHYGERSLTPEEAKRLARLCAETLFCRREVFAGEGTSPWLTPGYTFEMKEHYRSSFNRGYLAMEVEHEGSQAGYLTAGLSRGVDGGADHRVYYRNRFAAIPAEVQYRPERKTARPKVAGTLNARVDAAGSGQYAELDGFGRYKVVLPFDESGRGGGKASAWVRLATPYAGTDHGMHFPLHKGTEVLLTFRDGDPDRPVIAGAVPNPEAPSPVTEKNQTASEIRTGSGNRIHLKDEEGSERIVLHVPKQQSFIRIGAPNDPLLGDDGDGGNGDGGNGDGGNGDGGNGDDYYTCNTTEWGIAEKTNGWLEMEACGKNVVVLGELTDWVMGPRIELAALSAVFMTLLGSVTIQVPKFLALVNFHKEVELESMRATLKETALVLAETEAVAAEQRVFGEVKQVFVDRVNAMAAETSAAGEKLSAAGSETLSNLSTVQARAQKLESIGSQVKTAGTKMKVAGSAVIAAGSHFQTVGTSMRESGTAVDDSTSFLETAGTIIENGGVIVEG